MGEAAAVRLSRRTKFIRFFLVPFVEAAALVLSSTAVWMLSDYLWPWPPSVTLGERKVYWLTGIVFASLLVLTSLWTRFWAVIPMLVEFVGNNADFSARMHGELLDVIKLQQHMIRAIVTERATPMEIADLRRELYDLSTRLTVEVPAKVSEAEHRLSNELHAGSRADLRTVLAISVTIIFGLFATVFTLGLFARLLGH